MPSDKLPHIVPNCLFVSLLASDSPAYYLLTLSSFPFEAESTPLPVLLVVFFSESSQMISSCSGSVCYSHC